MKKLNEIKTEQISILEAVSISAELKKIGVNRPEHVSIISKISNLVSKNGSKTEIENLVKKLPSNIGDKVLFVLAMDESRITMKVSKEKAREWIANINKSDISAEAKKAAVDAIMNKYIKKESENKTDTLNEEFVAIDGAKAKTIAKAWEKSKGDKESLIKKYGLKVLISANRGGEVKLGVSMEVKKAPQKIFAGLDLQDNLIFVTSNPMKIYDAKGILKLTENIPAEE